MAFGDGAYIVGSSDTGMGSQAVFYSDSQWFGGLGHIPGGPFYQGSVRGISADGAVVVGIDQYWAGDPGERLKYGQRGIPLDRGMVGLGDLSGRTPFNSTAHAVSADGSAVVGCRQ